MSGFKRTLLSGIMLFSLLFVVTAPQQAAGQIVRDRYVIIIALDGLRSDIFYDYVYKGAGNPPANSFFRQLYKGAFQKHVRADNTLAIFPSTTFAAWGTVFSGTYPGKHGISASAFYDRHQDKLVDFGGKPGYGELLNCDVPASIQLYGWDIDCGELYSMMTTVGFFAFPSILSLNVLELYDLFRSNLGLVSDIIRKMPEPCVTVWIPIGLFGIPIPLNFCLIDLYANGGSHNSNLLSRTVYNYAQELDLNYYVVNSFTNRTNLDALGGRIAWTDLYGGGLKGIDNTWARPSYSTVHKAMVASDPLDYKYYDKEAIPRAIQYIKSSTMPHILTLYLSSIDSESHQYQRFGHSSLEDAQFFGLRLIDEELFSFHNFLKTLPEYSKIIFLLIADHGQTPHGAQIAQSLPRDRYIFIDDGFMAYVYIKNSVTGRFSDLPQSSDVVDFLRDVLPNPGISGINDQKNLQVVAARDPDMKEYEPYKWNGSIWAPITFDSLEASPNGFLDPATRIQGVNNLERSGDIIFLPGCTDDCTKNVAFGATPATHGSLREKDSVVPFYIFGQPITQAIQEPSAWVICGARQVDIIPTVLSLFGAYEMYNQNFDGKPLVFSDLRANLDDFVVCLPGGASDFLVGRWINYDGELTRTILHNPSAVTRDAVLVYYGWHEDYKSCQVVNLTPHGFISIEPQTEGGGIIEIRAGPAKKEKRPAGLVGYTVYEVGQHTTGFDQLTLTDPVLFEIKKRDLYEVDKCACALLKQKDSPLIKYFCEQLP